MTAGRPKLRADVRIVRLSASAPARRYLVTTADARQFQVSDKLGQLLQLMDGTRDLAELAREASALLGRDVDPAELAGLLTDRIERHALLDQRPGEMPAGVPARAPGPLALAVPFLPAARIAPLTRALAWLFHPAVLAVLTAASLVAHGLLYARYAADLGAVRIFEPPNYLVTFALVLGSMLLHELGHATACRRHGCRHGPIGIGFYLIFPVFYTDVDDAWRLPRRARMAIDFGGIYFQLVSVLVLVAVFMTTRSPAVLGAVLLIDTIMLVALHPFFRYDGYWLVSDLLGIPNLHRRSREAMQALLTRLAGRPRPAPSFFQRLGRTTGLLLTVYAVGSHLFFAGFVVWCGLVLGPNLLLDYPRAAWASTVAMTQAVSQGRVLTLLNELLRLVLSTAALVVVFSLVRRAAGTLVTRGRTAS